MASPKRVDSMGKTAPCVASVQQFSDPASEVACGSAGGAAREPHAMADCVSAAVVTRTSSVDQTFVGPVPPEPSTGHTVTSAAAAASVSAGVPPMMPAVVLASGDTLPHTMSSDVMAPQLVDPYVKLRPQGAVDRGAAEAFLRRDLQTYDAVRAALSGVEMPVSYVIKGQSMPSGLVTYSHKEIWFSRVYEPRGGRTFFVSDSFAHGKDAKVLFAYDPQTDKLNVWRKIRMDCADPTNSAPDKARWHMPKEARLDAKRRYRRDMRDPREVVGPRPPTSAADFARETGLQKLGSDSVKPTGLFYFDGKAYTQLPLAGCGDMFDLVLNARSLPRSTASCSIVPNRMLRELVIQVAAFHARTNCLHRDIKPDNIIIDENGELHLCDFGLAIDRASAFGAVGTPGYFAPEMVDTTRCKDSSSDTFSLGLTYLDVFTTFAIQSRQLSDRSRNIFLDHHQQRGDLDGQYGGAQGAFVWLDAFARWHEAVVQRGADGTVTVDFAKAPPGSELTVYFSELASLNPDVVNFVLRMVSPDPAHRPSDHQCVQFVTDHIQDDPKSWDEWRAHIQRTAAYKERQQIHQMLRRVASTSAKPFDALPFVNPRPTRV